MLEVIGCVIIITFIFGLLFAIPGGVAVMAYSEKRANTMKATARAIIEQGTSSHPDYVKVLGYLNIRAGKPDYEAAELWKEMRGLS